MLCGLSDETMLRPNSKPQSGSCNVSPIFGALITNVYQFTCCHWRDRISDTIDFKFIQQHTSIILIIFQGNTIELVETRLGISFYNIVQILMDIIWQHVSIAIDVTNDIIQFT